MPVIEMPKDRAPLFGEHAQIVIGASLARQLREWQQKKRRTEPPPATDDSAGM